MLHPPQPGARSGYVLGGPVVATAGLIAASVAGAAVVVMLSAIPGGHDPRSPFVRLMLIVCVITGRRPGDYLPAGRGRGRRRRRAAACASPADEP